MPNQVAVRGVWVEINGTVEGAQDLAIENEGEVLIWSYANTLGDPVGTFK